MRAARAAGTCKTKRRQVIAPGNERCRTRTFDGDQRECSDLGQLDVVGDEELLERVQERSGDPYVDVEQHAVRQRGDPHVGGDTPLDGQEERRTAAPRPESGDVVREHPLQEGDAVLAGRAHERAKPEIE